MNSTRDLTFGPFGKIGHCTYCGTSDVYVYPGPRAELEGTNFDPAICQVAETHPCACPRCCAEQIDGHDYAYEPSMRRFECEICGDEPPRDWSGYDVD